jgi:hypothetical protein
LRLDRSVLADAAERLAAAYRSTFELTFHHFND